MMKRRDKEKIYQFPIPVLGKDNIYSFFRCINTFEYSKTNSNAIFDKELCPFIKLTALLNNMDFDLDKKNSLTKIDKSYEKKIDSKILDLIRLINSKKKYYTTSSCSGRICLMKIGKTKKDSIWLHKSHEEIDDKELKQIIDSVKNHQDMLWFFQEGAIIHVCCKTLDDADKILKICREDFKKSGIINTRKFTVEISSADRIEVPIHRENTPDKFIVELVKEANKKHRRNLSKLDNLLKKLKKL